MLQLKAVGLKCSFCKRYEASRFVILFIYDMMDVTGYFISTKCAYHDVND